VKHTEHAGDVVRCEHKSHKGFHEEYRDDDKEKSGCGCGK